MIASVFLIPCISKNNSQACEFSALQTFPASDWAERSPVNTFQKYTVLQEKVLTFLR